MSLFEIIEHTDIEHTAILSKLSDRMVKANKFLYITSTKNLKNIRRDSDFLNDKLKSYTKDQTESNLFSIMEFLQDTSREVYATQSYLSNADQKFILAKVIKYKYKDVPAQYATIYKMRHDIFDLFKLLMFYNTEINSSQIEAIRSDFSDIEAGLFDLYAIYKTSIDGIINYIKTGKEDKFTKDILGDNFSKKKNVSSIDLFINCQRDVIDRRIASINALFIDGFLFFDDMQKYIITTAYKSGKKVFFVKKTFNDASSNFLFERTLKQLINECGQSIREPKIYNSINIHKTALDYAKDKFPIASLKHNDEIKKMFTDGSIRVMQPFINREEELRFVARSISGLLEKAYTGDIAPLKKMLAYDIAIVLAIEKEKYEERISNIFREIGMFIFKKDLINTEFADIDVSEVKEVYFRRTDFINTIIHRANGEALDYHAKHVLFEKCFSKIEINKSDRPIATYPIGQFVLELYNIIQNGMNVDSFKNILYSNWRFNIDKFEYKWSEFISDFKYLEMYVENLSDINDWLREVEKLKGLQVKIIDNPLYEYHPLKQLKHESLVFFIELLHELSEIIFTITSVFGSIDKHLDALKSIVMKADKLFAFQNEDLEFEQIIVKRLVSAVSDIAGSSLVSNIDSKYFAENVRSMLKDWEDQNQNEENDMLRLNVVNLENMKKFKYSYFIMLEMNKYPRKYFNSFPYTVDVLTILDDDKYGINIKPSSLFGLDYHLQLERYLFKNVLDFTTEKLTITLCEKEYNQHNRPSIYLDDLVTLFDSDIIYTTPDVDLEEFSYDFKKALPSAKLDKKENYSLTELAIFKLCPKLYFHMASENKGAYLTRLQLRFYFEAILYCDLFKRYMDYNLQNKKVYSTNDSEYKTVLQGLKKDCYNENIIYFDFFNDYEANDIFRNVSNKIIGFIENAKTYLSSNVYTIIPYQNRTYQGDSYNLVIEHDNRVVDYADKTWRMSQNSTYLEFLVLKTSSGKSELKHYKDMIRALDANAPDEDRVNLVSRIIAKINIQFDSKRYVGDGILRTNELVDEICAYDFSKAKPMSSNYCTYCRFCDVCLSI